MAGESAATRNTLENLITTVNKSVFDIGELLNKIKSNHWYSGWGYNSFVEYINTLEIKPRKAQYLVRIAEVAEELGLSRETYEPVGVAKLRAITSIDLEKQSEVSDIPNKTWVKELIGKAKDMSLEEVQQHVSTIKGEVGEEAKSWLNFRPTKLVLDNTIRPALELAKNAIGTVGKDEDGLSKDASDTAALETICVEFLNDPANHVLPEEKT